MHAKLALHPVELNVWNEWWQRNNGGSTVAEPSRRGRRLSRHLVDEEMLHPLALDLCLEDQCFRTYRLHTDAAATSSFYGGVIDNIILENREEPDARLSNHSRTINGGSDDIEQIRDSSYISISRNSALFIEDHQPMAQTSIDLYSSDEKFTYGDQVDYVAGLPTSTEISCVSQISAQHELHCTLVVHLSIHSRRTQALPVVHRRKKEQLEEPTWTEKVDNDEYEARGKCGS
ncbi:hypothetical protein RJT34_16482 [Clitoria ternatea]|uniref:Uncharacterized protein n=1 Tax=Clitoria ternatea TaxID=43366 RepID=A0AAN9PDQ4_CLITE